MTVIDKMKVVLLQNGLMLSDEMCLKLAAAVLEDMREWAIRQDNNMQWFLDAIDDYEKEKLND